MKARCNLLAIALLLAGARIASAQCYTFSSGSAASFTAREARASCALDGFAGKKYWADSGLRTRNQLI